MFLRHLKVKSGLLKFQNVSRVISTVAKFNLPQILGNFGEKFSYSGDSWKSLKAITK